MSVIDETRGAGGELKLSAPLPFEDSIFSFCSLAIAPKDLPGEKDAEVDLLLCSSSGSLCLLLLK